MSNKARTPQSERQILDAGNGGESAGGGHQRLKPGDSKWRFRLKIARRLCWWGRVVSGSAET